MLGKMGQGTECTDRPTEVSVIRFVSRNRTVEEIAPKKEIFTCKKQGCGKIFTNHDEFRTHEALEELKIRFICREPGCGEEMSDPGTMWRHYQELHSNETNVFVCPYTNCGSLHNTSDNLEEHVENCHRQSPTLPTEPEIICFEGPPANAPTEEEDDNPRNLPEDEDEEPEDCPQNEADNLFEHKKKSNNKFMKITRKTASIISSQNLSTSHDIYTSKDERLKKNDVCDTKGVNLKGIGSTDDNFYNNIYEENVVRQKDDETQNFVIENSDEKLQDHMIDLGNLESVFRSGLEGEMQKIESNNEANENCSDDEEYTPKKQRMSRYKHEHPYKCEINGCGKMYKYISHYRHHQDSHKINDNNSVNKQLSKSLNSKTKSKASTISFFLCKMPGCGAQAQNVTSLRKHYQENHENSKVLATQSTKSNQSFRCKVPNCGMEFQSSGMLHKHLNQVHTISASTKTGNGGSIRFIDDITSQTNFKTEFKANYNVSMTNDNNDCKNPNSLRIKEENNHD